MIEYTLNPNITVKQFIEILTKSTLGERRPIDDLETIKGMIENSNLMITCTEL